jgi:hypothetical protein
MNDQALKDYFFFDDSDLNANRNGEFSKKQRDKFTQDNKVASRFIRVTGLVLTFIALIYPVNILIQNLLAAQQDTRQPMQWNIGWTIVAIFVGAIGCYFLYIGFIDQSHSPAKFQVQKVEGPVRFVAMTGSQYTEVEYGLRIGKTKMEVVDQALTEIMKEGDRYSAYFYNPDDGTGNQVLSLERISKE